MLFRTVLQNPRSVHFTFLRRASSSPLLRIMDSATVVPKSKRKRGGLDVGSSGCDNDRAPAATPASRGFDMLRYRLRHVALHVAYLGHEYHGFAAQSQESASSSPNTIERALFAALQRSCLIESESSCGYMRCGRTDRGVSAAGQIVSLRLRSIARRTHVAQGQAGFDASSSSALSSPPEVMGSSTPSHTSANGWIRSGVLGDAPVHNGGEPFPAPYKEHDYASTLNTLLPPDIRVLGWADVRCVSSTVIQSFFLHSAA
jgi:tRNA pseudouridine38/39 synthase